VTVKVKVGQTRNIRLVAAGEKRPVIVPDSIALGIDTVGEYVRAIDGGQGIIITPESDVESANLVISHSNTSSIANTVNGNLQFVHNATFDQFGHATSFTTSGLNANNFILDSNVIGSKNITLGSTEVTLGGTTSELRDLTLAEIGEFSISANTISAPGDLNLNLALSDAVVNVGTHRVINVEDPIDTLDVVNKRYLEFELGRVVTTIKVFDDPILPSDATNKRYVDNIVKGLVVRPSALGATTGDLGATFATGNTSYSDTLTIDPVNILYIDDITTWDVGDNLVVKDQTDATQNGSYDLIQQGSANTAWVFQRTVWSNEDSEIAGSYEFVTDGTQNGQTGWVITVDDASSFNINDDNINWTQFQGEGTFTAGNGLTLNGTQFNVDSTLPLTAITPTGAGDVLTINGDGALTLPTGESSDRPTAAQGMVRFNSTDGQFEGYDGIAWSGLGGVIDVDQDTKIVAETSPGSDNDQIQVFAGGTLSATFGDTRVDFTGDVGIAGNLTIGDQDSDTVAFAADVTSHIIPDQDRIYSLGSASKNWHKIHVDTVASSDGVINMDGTGAVKFPSANTALRPTGPAGMLRFNTEEGRFEGYDGSIWAGLAGSVIDLDKNTFIIAETSAGANNNELDFYTDAIQRMQIGATGDLTFGSNLDKLIINYNTGDMFVNGKLTATNNLVIDPVGNIDVNSNVLTGLPNPVNPTDAVNLGYLDTQFSSGLTIIDQANTYADGVNLLASPTLDLGRGLELIELDTANNVLKFGLDAPMVGSEGMYGTDGFTPRIRITEDGRIDFATEIPLELQANAIPNFTETSRDIIGLMFTDGTHEGITVFNDDANDVMNLYANDFNIVLAGDLSGQSTVSRLSNTTVTANITADYISHVTSDGANTGIIVTHTAGPSSNSAIELDYTELNTRYITTSGGTSTEDIIAPRFVDENDNQFYVDPNGISRLNKAEFGYGSTFAEIKMRDGPGSFSHFYASQGKIGFLNNTYNYAAYSDKATGDWVVNKNVRAEKFIDVDSTTYFLHPGGTDSLLKALQVEDNLVAGNISVISSTISTAAGDIILDPTGNLDVNNNLITNVADPVSLQDAATKSYVDSVAQGLRIIPAALAATVADLVATYSLGTLTDAAGATSAFTLDGVTDWNIGDKVLVKDQTTASENGSYELTTIGDANTPWVLTRGEYFNETSEIPGAFQFITDGTVNNGTGWVAQVADTETFVLDTDAVTFYQFSGAGTYSAGEALTLTGTTFSVTNPNISFAADNGSNDVVTLGETITIAGVDGVDTTVSDNNISIAVNELDGGTF
jgi:hypothetical protein